MSGLSEFFDCAHKESHTPDAWALEKRKYHLLFVYDGMMQGEKQHELLEYDAICLNSLMILKWGVQTFHNTFSLWKHRDSGIGIALRKEYAGAPHHRIRGELYAIKPHLLIELDTLKQNGVLFDRVPAKLVISYVKSTDSDSDYSRIQTRDDVWMYVGRQSYWEPQLSAYDFERCTIVRHHITRSKNDLRVYYHY